MGDSSRGLKSVIVVDPSRCSGCRYCELWCSFTHEGVFSLSLSRIIVVRDDSIGMDHPILCKHCNPAPCIQACPTSALQIGGYGAIVVNEGYCTSCGSCVEACPYGAIRLHPERLKPLVCDLCNGKPVCTTKCPTNALKILIPVHIGLDKYEVMGKEYKYAFNQHEKLIEVWAVLFLFVVGNVYTC